MLLREREFHGMNEWIDAVECTRRDLGITPGTSEDVAPRLAEVGMDTVVSRIRTNYRALVRRTGVHYRYVEYFAACVVSHFHDGDAHRAPAWLIERLRRWRASESPVAPGMVRIEFVHGREPASPPDIRSVVEFIHMAIGEGKPKPAIYGPTGTVANPPKFSIGEPIMIVITPHSSQPSAGTLITPERQTVPLQDLFSEMQAVQWKNVPVPYGLEILWPYEVPMLGYDEAELSNMRARLGEAGIVTTWVLVDRFVAFYDGGCVMLPLRTVEGLPQPTTLQHLVGLPDAAIVNRLTMPIPMVVDGSGAVQACELDTSPAPGQLRIPWVFRHLGEVQPLQPKVTRDRSLPNDERPFARTWQDLAQRIAVHPTLRGGRGAPQKRTRVPGLRIYSKLVGDLYRQKLNEWGEKRRALHEELGEPNRPIPDLSPEDRRVLWDSARREVRRQIPQEHRNAIPADLKDAIDAEAPWRSSGQESGIVTGTSSQV